MLRRHIARLTVRPCVRSFSSNPRGGNGPKRGRGAAHVRGSSKSRVFRKPFGSFTSDNGKPQSSKPSVSTSASAPSGKARPTFSSRRRGTTHSRFAFAAPTYSEHALGVTGGAHGNSGASSSGAPVDMAAADTRPPVAVETAPRAPSRARDWQMLDHIGDMRMLTRLMLRSILAFPNSDPMATSVFDRHLWPYEGAMEVEEAAEVLQRNGGQGLEDELTAEQMASRGGSVLVAQDEVHGAKEDGDAAPVTQPDLNVLGSSFYSGSRVDSQLAQYNPDNQAFLQYLRAQNQVDFLPNDVLWVLKETSLRRKLRRLPWDQEALESQHAESAAEDAEVAGPKLSERVTFNDFSAKEYPMDTQAPQERSRRMQQRGKAAFGNVKRRWREQRKAETQQEERKQARPQRQRAPHGLSHHEQAELAAADPADGVQIPLADLLSRVKVHLTPAVSGRDATPSVSLQIDLPLSLAAPYGDHDLFEEEEEEEAPAGYASSDNHRHQQAVERVQLHDTSKYEVDTLPSEHMLREESAALSRPDAVTDMTDQAALVEQLSLDSVKRKRVKKMNKLRLKKRRRRDKNKK